MRSAGLPLVARLLLIAAIPAIAFGMVVRYQLAQADASVAQADVLREDAQRVVDLMRVLGAVRTERLFVQGVRQAREFGLDDQQIRSLTGIDLAAEARVRMAITAQETSRRGLTATVADLPPGRVEMPARPADGPADARVLGALYDDVEGSLELLLAAAEIRLRDDAAATADGVTVLAEALTLTDLGMIERLLREQLNHYFAAVTAVDAAGRDSSRLLLAASTSAIDELVTTFTETNPSLGDALGRLRASPAWQAIDALIDAQLRPGAADAPFDQRAVGSLGEVLASTLPLVEQVNGLVDAAALRVEASATRASDAALRDRRSWLLAGMAVGATGVVAALLVSFTVSRPLKLLGHRAAAVSNGHLGGTDLRGGPREVVTASAAIGHLERSLLEVRDRAELLSAGELDELEGRPPMAGPLGQLLGATIDRLAQTMRFQELRHRELEHAATHDPLTGLLNRSGIKSALERFLTEAELHGRQVAVVFVDLDAFKAANDAFGHDTGDTVLQQVAARLLDEAPEALVGRLGGDEFVVLLADVPAAAAAHLAARIVAAISQPFLVDAASVRIGASVGVGMVTGALSVPQALRIADAAVYEAKAAGRGRVVVHDRLTTPS